MHFAFKLHSMSFIMVNTSFSNYVLIKYYIRIMHFELHSFSDEILIYDINVQFIKRI